MNKSVMLKWLQEGNIHIPTTLLTHYHTLKLNEKELVLLLQVLAFLDKGKEFPTPSEIAANMSIDSVECHEMLSQLIRRGYITIIDGVNEFGIRFERYSIEPLWEKLIDQYIAAEKKEEVEVDHKKETDLYTCFEQEFGRPLSPFEIETLGMWLDDDHHDTVIIKAALKEAVISGKLNFRYIDRILFEWKKNGIKTLQQAQNHGKKFRSYQSSNKEQEPEAPKTKSVQFYNWLEQ